MIVLNDIVGDEDDTYLGLHFFNQYLNQSIRENFFKAMECSEKYSSGITSITNIVYDKPIRYVSFDVEINRE